MNKDIYVMIIKDEELGKKLVHEHFEKDKITYAGLFKAEKRTEIAKILDAIEE